MDRPAVCRLAQRSDLPFLAQSRWEFRVEEDGRTEEEESAFVGRCLRFLEDALSSGRWALWLAELDGAVVAHAFLQVVEKVPTPGRNDDALAYLTNVYTTPAHRDQGIGQALLRHVQAWAVAHDLELVVVWPSEKSRSLYERAGFRASREIMEMILRPE